MISQLCFRSISHKDIILKTLQSVTHQPWALPRTSYFLLSGCLRTCLPPFNSLGREQRGKSQNYVFHEINVQFPVCLGQMGKVCTVYQDEHHETQVVLNSNLMIPDFPDNIEIFFLLRLDVDKSQFSFSKLRQPTGQRLGNVRTQQTNILICADLILIL